MIIKLVFSLLEAPHPSFMFLVFVHMIFFIPLHRLNNNSFLSGILLDWHVNFHSHATSLDLSTKISSKRCCPRLDHFDFEMISSSIGLFSIM